jgi:hypothetical protein
VVKILDFLNLIHEMINKLGPISTMVKFVITLGGMLLTKKSKEPVLSKANYDASVLSWKKNNENDCTIYTERGIRLKIRSWRNKKK